MWKRLKCEGNFLWKYLQKWCQIIGKKRWNLVVTCHRRTIAKNESFKKDPSESKPTNLPIELKATIPNLKGSWFWFEFFHGFIHLMTWTSYVSFAKKSYNKPDRKIQQRRWTKTQSVRQKIPASPTKGCVLFFKKRKTEMGVNSGW